jgi:hypothetical protein
LNFKCFDDDEQWLANVNKIDNRINYYEFLIKSRSSIMTILGTTSRGNFACFPDFNVGCHLVNLKDMFWNKEKLIEVLGKADGITVASTLYNLSNKLLI